MHYFSVEQIGRYRTMPTTPMALLSALDRNGLRNPDYFRSSTYLFTFESASRIHLDEQMVSSHDPLPYLSGLTQQCLINRFLPPILLLLYATSQFQDARIDPFFSFFFFFPRMKKIYELSIPNRTIIFHFLSIFASNFLYLYFTLKSIVQIFPKYTYSTIVYIYICLDRLTSVSSSPQILHFFVRYRFRKKPRHIRII